MGTLGNVLVRGFLFFSSTYQNVCYRRCSTKKYFWWKNRIPFENLHHVILGVPPKFQIVGGRVFLCRRFLGVFDESVLQGSTLTGWSISWLDWILLRQLVAWCHCNLAYGEKNNTLLVEIAPLKLQRHGHVIPVFPLLVKPIWHITFSIGFDFS